MLTNVLSSIAICALSPSSVNCYLAYPSPTPSPTSPSGGGRDDSHGPSGDVLIFDCLTLQVVNIVQAHRTSVSNISINSEGTMLATASDKVLSKTLLRDSTIYNVRLEVYLTNSTRLFCSAFVRVLSFAFGRYPMRRDCFSSGEDRSQLGYIRSLSTSPAHYSLCLAIQTLSTSSSLEGQIVLAMVTDLMEVLLTGPSIWVPE